jgi:hypothetical protein
MMHSLKALAVILLDENQLDEEPADNSDQWLYHTAIDFNIVHNETVPQF